MRWLFGSSWAGGVLALCAMGCGSSVTIEDDGARLGPTPSPSGDPSSPPPPGPTPPDPDDPDPEPLLCSGSLQEISIDFIPPPAGCETSGLFTLELAAIDPLPATDGFRLDFSECGGQTGCACAVELHGVGAGLADAFPPVIGATYYGVVEPNHIELYEPTPCFLCVGCPCPNALPVLAAYDGSMEEPWVGMENTLVVRTDATTCHEAAGDCETAAYDLHAEAFLIDPGIGDDSPIGEVVLGEGHSGTIGGSGLTLRVRRASGRSDACGGPSLPIGSAAWVALREFAY